MPSWTGSLAAAHAQTAHRVRYDGSYRRIPYPGGDVPAEVGVCTDVVIRAYRALGIDLQQRVHEDMRRAFSAYPTTWGLVRPDPNIDHRRVPNLETYLRRHGRVLRVTRDASAYRPGDLVTWMLPGNLPHIGIVTREHSADGLRPLIVHNIGRGPEVEDMLFDFPITGHYRYLGNEAIPRSGGASCAANPGHAMRSKPFGSARHFFHDVGRFGPLSCEAPAVCNGRPQRINRLSVSLSR